MKTTLLILSLSISLASAGTWQQFRGNNVDGIASEGEYPKKFDGEKSIAWKVALPGQGLSSPIILEGGRVIVTCSSGPKEDRLHVICFDEKDGSKKWHRQFWATGRTVCHEKTAVAAPTPTSDGKHIYALFSSNDLVCLDLDGNLQWMRGLTLDYPNASNSLGLATSPVMAGGKLVVQIENDSESFAAGIDPANGANLWKIPRTKRANWSSPIVVGNTVILQGSKGLQGVDPATGEEKWSYAEGASTTPSSVVAPDGTVYVPSHGLTKLKPSESSAPEQVWNSGSLRPGTASPIVVGDKVYIINRAGVLNCATLEKGESLWKARLQGPFSGSPVVAGSTMYVFSERKGLGQIVDISGEGEAKVVSTIELGETILCTPALANGAIFVRSDKHLWKLQ